MEELYIVDAVNYLFRSYYAIPPMSNNQGESTNALFGFVRTLQKLQRDFQPSHLVCVFDGPDNKKSRQTVYAEYKMHRKAAPEDLLPQFKLAYEYCTLAGIPTLCIDGVEADDTIATAALLAKKHKAKAFICSADKDLMQLVDDHIFLLQLHKDNLLVDAKKVHELFGVKPAQMLDLLAIMGDASDNIPGLEGFGPKTAATLLNDFGTLDYLLEHPEKVKGEKKQEILRTQKDTALMSRELARLQTNIDIPHELSFYALKDPNTNALSDFFQEMKFSSLQKEQPQPVKAKSKATVHLEYTLVNDPKELLDNLQHEKEICIDTETTDVDPMLAHLVGVGIGVKPGVAYYIPKTKESLAALKTFFAHTKAGFYGHNIKYDYHILKQVGIELKNICFDTLLASYVIDPQNRRHNLDDLALDHFKHMKIDIKSVIGKGTMRDAPVEKVKEYCCEDVDYTMRLKELFEVELGDLGPILREIELPLLPILAEMEETGIALNTEKLAEIGKDLVKELNALKKAIYEYAGGEFNLNSPKQLSDILYNKLEIKSSTTSTAADVLEELDHPIIKLILDYRSLEKLRSTYVEALPHSVNPITNRIHCTFNQSVAATGRLSCTNPNLQNIPKHSAIRACFHAKEGYSFVSADYSQIELRLLAHFSQDPNLLEAFNKGIDIHRFTAALVFDIAQDAVTDEMRQSAKAVNFGILYGQSAFGLSKSLGIPMKDASYFIKTYFERYPRIEEYLEKSKEFARKKGYSQTLTGRRRPIPDIHNKNQQLRAAAERLAINTPLQGTAADLIKIAMIQIDEEIKKQGYLGKMILQIHDELIFEVPDDEVEIFKKLSAKKMSHVFKLDVPLDVFVAVGKNWAEC